MRRQGGGRILYNSSVLGLVAFPYRGAYVASKFALEGLADALRLEPVSYTHLPLPMMLANISTTNSNPRLIAIRP